MSMKWKKVEIIWRRQSRASVDKRVLWPVIPSVGPERNISDQFDEGRQTQKKKNPPCSNIRIIISLLMLLDILRRFPTGRITSHTGIVRILIYPHVIKSHIRRHQFVDSLVDRCKTHTHAQVHDNRHGFHRNHALPNVAVLCYSPGIECPGLIRTDKPSDIPLVSWRVLECISLIGFAVVPVVVQIAKTRH